MMFPIHRFVRHKKSRLTFYGCRLMTLGNPAVLSVGPVAFRPRLATGLAFTILLYAISNLRALYFYGKKTGVKK